MIDSLDIHSALDKLNKGLPFFANSIVYSSIERYSFGRYDNSHVIIALSCEQQAIKMTGLSATKIQEEIKEFTHEFIKLDSASCISTTQSNIAGRMVRIDFLASSADKKNSTSIGMMTFALNLMKIASASEPFPSEIIKRWILGPR